MDKVIDLRKYSIGTPLHLLECTFIGFESVELFDDIQLEYRIEPARKLERDILVSKGTSSVFSFLGKYTDCTSSLFPLLDRHLESICTSIISKTDEFVRFKIWIMNSLPRSEKLECILGSYPTLDTILAIVGEYFCHIDIAPIIYLDHRDSYIIHLNSSDREDFGIHRYIETDRYKEYIQNRYPSNKNPLQEIYIIVLSVYLY